MDTIYYDKLTLSLDKEYNTYYVTDCEKDATIVTIPKQINGIYVVGIGNNAFTECEKLEKVIFPEYDINDIINEQLFKEIGEHAFSYCISLKSILLPDTVCTILKGAFYQCKSLEEISFPSDAYVGPYAFYNCSSLKKVSNVSMVSEGVFGYCTSLKNLPITNNVDEISEDAFEHCDSLTKITIPASINLIEGLAFRGCKNLTEVHFEDTANWYWKNYYTNQNTPLNVSDPVKSANMLSKIDFDDGVRCWFKRL